jgi:hypothetical protein
MALSRRELLRQFTSFTHAQASGHQQVDLFARFRALVEQHHHEHWGPAANTDALHNANAVSTGCAGALPEGRL